MVETEIHRFRKKSGLNKRSYDTKKNKEVIRKKVFQEKKLMHS